MSCRVCNGNDVVVFDRRDQVSLLQNRLFSTRQEARSAATGALAMTACRACGFVWNAAFEPDRLNYDPYYENDQANSTAFREHLAGRARRILGATQEEPAHFVEVGCGQGDFLKRLLEAGGGRIGSATGFDPAWRGEDGAGPAGAQILRTYFTRDTAPLLRSPPDAILSRHTIEHVPDPVAFLTALHEASEGQKPARLFLETPCVSWIIDNLQFQDFFYEHCSLFTAGGLVQAMRRAGFRPSRIERVFGGQYLWAEADQMAPEIEQPSQPPLAIDRWQAVRTAFIKRWRETIEQRATAGPVYIWGAGAKGVTFSLLIDPEGALLAGAVDINPKKQGLFIPITGLEVLAPEQLPHRWLTLVVMNPNYGGEIEHQVGALGCDAMLLSLADAGSASSKI